MLTAEIVFLADGNFSDEIEIYFDRKGLDYLSSQLNHIREGKNDHVHLMSESWGLGNLDEQKHKENNRIVHHLRFTLMTEAKPIEHAPNQG